MTRETEPGANVAHHNLPSVFRIRVVTAKTADATIIQLNGGVQLRYISQSSSTLALGDAVIHPHGVLAPDIHSDDTIVTALAVLGPQAEGDGSVGCPIEGDSGGKRRKSQAQYQNCYEIHRGIHPTKSTKQLLPGSGLPNRLLPGLLKVKNKFNLTLSLPAFLTGLATGGT